MGENDREGVADRQGAAALGGGAMSDRYKTKTKADPYKLDPLERAIWVAAFAASMAKPYMLGVNNSPFVFADAAVNRFRDAPDGGAARPGIGAEDDSW